MTHNLTPQSARKGLNPQELDRLVSDELKKLVTAAEEFSAYTVTLNLRTAHPDTEIRHDDVRESVHVQMLILPAGYTLGPKTYPDGNTALTYFPPTIPGHNSPPNLPIIAPTIQW